MADLGSGPPQVDAQAGEVTVLIPDGVAVLPEVVRQLDAAGLALSDLAVRRPTLDDVFLTLTGQATQPPDPSGSTSHWPTKAGAAACDKEHCMTTLAPATLDLAISDTAVMTRRYLYHYLRKPSLLGIALVQPVLFVLLWTYVFSGAIQTPGGITYVDYLMPGLFILAIAFGSANTGVGLADDLARGLIDRFRAWPAPPCWSAGPWPIPPATPSSCC